MNNLLLIVLLTLASFSFGQGNSAYDQRLMIRLHRSNLRSVRKAGAEFLCRSFV